MQPFHLVLHETYFRNGFFNVPVAFDQYIRSDNGSIRIYIGNTDELVEGRVDRTANSNGTARVFGGRTLRDWFKQNFSVRDVLTVKFLSPDVILLLPNVD